MKGQNIPKPTFSPRRAALLWESIAFRRRQLAANPGHPGLALWLRQSEKEFEEEMALRDGFEPGDLEDISDLDGMSDDELLAALFD